LNAKPEPAAAALATLRKSRANHPQFPFHYCALVILTCSVLSCPQWTWASDAGGVAKPNSAIGTPSAPSTTQPAIQEVSLPKSEKYDVERIGQRNVGHGINLYSLQKERALGETMAAAVDRGTRFVTDAEVTRYVGQLAQNLARHSDADVPFSIKVIDSSDSRIFALPGGFLYVDKGLIQAVDSEAELAGLMAHEIAHVAARHATRFATRKHAWTLLSIPLAMASGPAALGTRQIIPLSLRKFSRDFELEADLLGIEYQYAAGYDPQAFLDALERLAGKAKRNKASNSSSKTFHDQIKQAFAYYPPTEDRIEKLHAAITSFLPAREDYILDTSEFQSVKARLGDRPILRRHRSADSLASGPVLRRGSGLVTPDVATGSPAVTKGRLSPVLSYLPTLPE
jgi:predicted Zn-dependent protease